MNTDRAVERAHGAPFRVRAEALEDLEVVSSMLQDAIVPMSEIRFDAATRQFTMMTQRFRWERVLAAEREPAAAGSFERVHCAVQFRSVQTVRSHGIDLADRGQMLELLSIHVTTGQIDFAFAGGKTIRLSVDCLDCQVEDVGRSWPTGSLPQHADDPA